MLQLTDGTVMIQQGASPNWMRLTPDISGSYVNGVWTNKPISPMSVGRLYFASQVLPSGKVWVLGGEYSGPGILVNWSNTGEIYDPVANSWSPIAPYPNQTGCPAISRVTGTIASGSSTITGIYPYTTGLTVGWLVTGAGIPAGATILSVDSPTQIQISAPATSTSITDVLTFNHFIPLLGCFGDDPSMLLPGGKILAGNLTKQSSYIYDIATDTWSFAANKFYDDSSDEEGWVKLPNGNILTYDIFKTLGSGNGNGYAELYDPVANVWSSISPVDGTANGFLPVLSDNTVGEELGPALRLQDGRILVIGANGHTAIYTPSTNTWVAGPDTIGPLGGAPFLLGADDAPAAMMPNGHVLLAVDAGPGTASTGNTTAGSPVVGGIPSTAQLQTGWTVSGAGIPVGTAILSVDSPTQIHISRNATLTNNDTLLKFGGTFSRPTQVLDYNPGTGVIAPVSPAIPDPNLGSTASFVTRMLVLPTGQILFSDGGRQLWVYTPDGPVNPAAQPVLNQMSYNGRGLFTLTGRQLNGQSAGSSYGDDVESDENYPIIRLTDSSGNVYYARTTNWSTVGVAGGPAPQTVDFTLHPALPAGNYALTVSGAGISSFPLFVNITEDQAAGK